MYKKLWIFCCLILGFIAIGCGGGARKGAFEPAAPSQGYGGYPGVSNAKTASVEASPPPPTATSSGAGATADSTAPRAPSEPAQERRERPGLGTEWGESRDSRVHDV